MRVSVCVCVAVSGSTQGVFVGRKKRLGSGYCKNMDLKSCIERKRLLKICKFCKYQDLNSHAILKYSDLMNRPARDLETFQ